MTTRIIFKHVPQVLYLVTENLQYLFYYTALWLYLYFVILDLLFFSNFSDLLHIFNINYANLPLVSEAVEQVKPSGLVLCCVLYPLTVECTE